MTKRFTLPFAVLLALSPTVLEAQQRAATPATPTALGEFGSWRAYSVQGPNGKQCYALGTPQSSEPRDIQPGTARRGATNIFITHRPGQNVRNEVSVIIGYAFKANSNATLEVVSAQGTRRFTMFTRDQGAWLQNAAEEAQLIEAMRRGREIRLRGTSQRDTNTTDVYSLNGISQALDRVGQECRT